MKVNLYKDYWLTSSVGDKCFTLKTIKTIQDKKSKNYGQESEVTISYPVSIGNAVKTICQTEMFNSKATTLEGIIKEEKILQKMVEELGRHVGIDSIMKNIVYLSDETLSQGGYEERKKNADKDEVTEEPQKRTKKSKTA